MRGGLRMLVDRKKLLWICSDGRLMKLPFPRLATRWAVPPTYEEDWQHHQRAEEEVVEESRHELSAPGNPSGIYCFSLGSLVTEIMWQIPVLKTSVERFKSSNRKWMGSNYLVAHESNNNSGIFSYISTVFLVFFSSHLSPDRRSFTLTPRSLWTPWTQEPSGCALVGMLTTERPSTESKRPCLSHRYVWVFGGLSII